MMDLQTLANMCSQVSGKKSMAKFEDSGRHAFVMQVGYGSAIASFLCFLFATA